MSNIQKYGQKINFAAKKGKDRIYRSNKQDWMRWVKLVLIILSGAFLVIGVIRFGKRILAFLGLNKDAVAGQSGFDGTTLGSAINSLSGDYSGTSGSPNTTSNSESKPWRPIVDSIYEHLQGANLIVYPEIVNKLAHLSKEHVRYAVYYWKDRYKSGVGKSLYNFIKDEWGAESFLGIGGDYEPALGAIRDAFPELYGGSSTGGSLSGIFNGFGN